MRLNPLREVTRPTRHSPRRSFRHPTCVSQKRGFSWARNRSLNPEPRQRTDYSDRQIEAARRVLVDLGQVLARFEDCLVVVGGWVPDLLLTTADEPHIGSIDVDLALDASKLNDGRYADIIKLLLDTNRYRRG